VTPPIAVLGGGNGGHCMAADLTLMGERVALYEHPAFAERFRPTIERGGVELRGIGRTGFAKLHRVTTDLAEALAGVEQIHVAIPATGHEAFFKELVPALVAGQTVVVWAGDYGSLRLRQMLSESRPKLDVTIYEAHTLPYGARLAGPATVDLLLTAPRVLISALPATATAKGLPALKRLWPCLEPCQNVLMAALNNPNPIIHPPGSLLNTGRIQYSGGEFWMYREGITEAVARVIRQAFDEARGVAKALDGDLLEYLDRDFRTTASIMGVAFDAPFDTLGVIASIQGPHSIYDRYITEDLPMGLVPTVELGRLVGAPTPVIEALVQIGSVVCGEDYWTTGRTLTSLGLSGLRKDEILALVNG